MDALFFTFSFTQDDFLISIVSRNTNSYIINLLEEGKKL